MPESTVPAQAGPCDGMIRWIEALAERVERGMYAPEPLEPEYAESLGLCLFPQQDEPSSLFGRVFTVAVTRGIEVRASVVFMPEQRQWTYSIRIRLLISGQDQGAISAAERGFETCQLRSRHWAITKGSRDQEISGRVEHVQGDGVIGMYPLLREGGHRADCQTGRSFDPARLHQPDWEEGSFIYQSCSGQGLPGGSFGGELTFVPGSLMEPTGSPFDVKVAPFALNHPEILF